MRTSRVITRERGDQQSRNAWKNRWRTVDYAPRVQRRFEPRRFSAGIISPRWRGTAVASTPVRLVLCPAAATHRRVFSCAPGEGTSSCSSSRTPRSLVFSREHCSRCRGRRTRSPPRYTDRSVTSTSRTTSRRKRTVSRSSSKGCIRKTSPRPSIHSATARRPSSRPRPERSCAGRAPTIRRAASAPRRRRTPPTPAPATGPTGRGATPSARARVSSPTRAAPPADAPLAGTCYQWAGAAYDQSGCEHFGASLRVNATRASYRWLVEDPTAPGSIVPGPLPIAVAAPSYSVAPPAVAGAMPVLNADVDAPGANGYPTRYGDAFWLKIFKSEAARGIALDELTNDNPAVVPADQAHLETSWVFIQADPLITFRTSGKSSPSRGRTRNGGPIGSDSRAVVRRYELYEDAGVYDAVFHQAVCGLSNCAGPAPGEVGALISAQMTAANVVAPSISVARIGSGAIASSDRRINCGTTCNAAYTAGDVVTLTAIPAAGAVFSSWSGACTGTASTCSVAITDHLSVTAAFTTAAAAPTAPATPPPPATTTAVKVSVGISNKGRVVVA